MDGSAMCLPLKDHTFKMSVDFGEGGDGILTFQDTEGD